MLMLPRSRTALLLVAFFAISAIGRSEEKKPSFRAEQVAFYEKSVKPILVQRCFKCHGAGEKIKGELRLSNRAAALVGGVTGPSFDTKKPSDSLFIKAILNKRGDGTEVMPPSGKLPDSEIAILTKWVNERMPVSVEDLGESVVSPPVAGSVVTEDAKKFWAYQPVKLVKVPLVKDASPIDAFIQNKLNEKGLKPNGPAEKSALARRAYYDLLGLPPTPEQIDTFLADASPDAYSRLIDTLLASPHYGEKWGRHWLDIVRYAETNGYERDGPKPNAWRYRDYVIRSFNDDKPYDRFIKEQIAGDELPEWSADAIIATGYYRLGIWDDEPADAKQSLFDGYDDLVTVTAQGFLAMTVNCARCHDHKKDPIPQTDYYKLLAFFRDIRPFSDTRGTKSSTNTSDISAPEKRKIYEVELNARNERIRELIRQMNVIEVEAIKKLPAEDQRASEGNDRPRVIAKAVKFFEGDLKRDYGKLKRERLDLEQKPLPNQDLALSVNQCEVRPPSVHLLARGNPHAPRDEVISPGFPEVLGFPDPVIPVLAKGAKTSGRRTVLANWLASKSNPLTARVMVNRVWQYHFGKGLVPTPSDFGKLGEMPTHPELLDWLASDFVEGGWKIKRLHKSIMLSQTYQRSANANAANLTTDPANAFYWRFNMRRLAAEEVRDTILMASGKLNFTPFGPSVFPKIPREVLAGQSVPGQGWHYDAKNPTAGDRRSVYVFIKRSLQVPVLINHDQADTDSSCPVRYTTTVPTQALGMLNGEFTNEQATSLAKRLSDEFPGDTAKQVVRAIRLTTGRKPGDEEVAKDLSFIQKMKAKYSLDDSAALARYALLVLNANEFMYLD